MVRSYGASDRTRLDILDAMKKISAPVSVREVYEGIGTSVSIPTVRHQLGVLVDRGRVKEVRDGKQIRFDIIDRSKVGRRKGNKSGITGDEMMSMLSDKAMSMKAIAGSLNMTVRGVHYHLQKLIDDGKIGIVHNGKVNLYYRIYNK